MRLSAIAFPFKKRDVVMKKHATSQSFLPRMGEYLSGRARAWRLTMSGDLGTCFVPVQLGPDEFYGLDADAMLAITHGIEDLALEKARGRLMVSFQDLKYFDDHREQYWQLAATIEEVAVLGTGQMPRPERRIQFHSVGHTVLQHFWLVIYQAPTDHIMLMGRQLNSTEFIPEKRFLAYYTFNAPIIERTRHDIEAVLAGSSDGMPEFERMRSIDQAVRWVNEGFAREQETLAQKLEDIRSPGQSAQAFLTQYDTSLEHLQRMKQRLANLLIEPND
jgi:hypothetical protein